MSWDTDWANGVSETITEIQSIASNQITDEANIAALQTAVQPLASASGSSLSSVSATLIAGKFCEVFVHGVSGTSGSIGFEFNGVADVDCSFNNNEEFLFHAIFYYNSSTHKVSAEVISPLIDTNSRFQLNTLSGSPSSITLTFQAGTGGSVDNFVMKYV